MTLENIWHECIDPRRRLSSITNAAAVADDDGKVRVVVSATDPGVDNWLDTGGRHRGWLTIRWLDHPEAPVVTDAGRADRVGGRLNGAACRGSHIARTSADGVGLNTWTPTES